MKIGEIVTFPHQPKAWEKIVAFFGRKIPELDYYRVTGDSTFDQSSSGEIVWLEKLLTNPPEKCKL